VFAEMKYYKDPDEAVSSVIGVILMVAITVILAAVIASYVFGLAQNISMTKVVAATAQQTDGTHIVVTYRGGQDEVNFAGANVTITASDGTILPAADFTTAAGSTGWLSPEVGSFTTATYTVPPAFSGRDHVMVTAWFMGGREQVILDTFV
jgi:archaeal type IV pilus assembly protein PilA